jgi:hypothetical protein
MDKKNQEDTETTKWIQRGFQEIANETKAIIKKKTQVNEKIRHQHSDSGRLQYSTITNR